MGIFNTVNSSIAGAVIAFGVFLKDDLENKKIGNFELNRLLPIILLLVSETLNILYGYSIGENIIVSISNGLISTMIATYGYDVYKTLKGKRN